MLVRVNLTTQTVDDAPLPEALRGLAAESLADLSWTDAALGLREYAWLPLVRAAVAFDVATHRIAGETLTLGSGQVVATPVIEAIPEEEIAARAAAAIQARQREKLSTANTRCQGLLNALKAGYPDGEVLSWGQQVAEAKARAADEAAATPLLSALATARGVPLDLLSAKVLEKAAAYAAASGAIIGHRQRLEDALVSASTLTALEAVDVEAGWPA